MDFSDMSDSCFRSNDDNRESVNGHRKRKLSNSDEDGQRKMISAHFEQNMVESENVEGVDFIEIGRRTQEFLQEKVDFMCGPNFDEIGKSWEEHMNSLKQIELDFQMIDYWYFSQDNSMTIDVSEGVVSAQDINLLSFYSNKVNIIFGDNTIRLVKNPEFLDYQYHTG